MCSVVTVSEEEEDNVNVRETGYVRSYTGTFIGAGWRTLTSERERRALGKAWSVGETAEDDDNDDWARLGLTAAALLT